MNKPKFDPSKPFEAADKPPFNPNQPFDVDNSVDEVEKEGGLLDSAKAGLQGFGQAASFGYLPNIQAAAQKITDPVFGLLTGKEVEPEGYVEARDAYGKRDQSLQKENPGSYLMGQVAGSIATPSPIKGGSALKAAGRGLLESAAYNPGEVEGEISGLQIKDRLKQGLIGGAIGGGLTKVGQSVKGLGPKLDKASDFLAIKALGGQKGDFKRLMKKNEVERVAKFAKEEGLIGLGKNVESASEGSKNILKEVGPQIGEVYEKVQNKVNDPKFLQSLNEGQAKKLLDSELSPLVMGEEILNDIKKEWKNKAGGRQVINRVRQELKQLQGMGPIADVEDLFAYRKSVDDLVNYDKAVKDMPGVQKGLKRIRDMVQEKVDNRIKTLDELVGGEDLKNLKALNKRYSGASNVNQISGPAFAGEEAKMALGLPEIIGGGAIATGAGLYGTSQGDPSSLPESLAKGLIGAAAIKGARRYGPGLLMRGLEGAGQASEKVGGLLESPKLQSVIDRSRR